MLASVWKLAGQFRAAAGELEAEGVFPGTGRAGGEAVRLLYFAADVLDIFHGAVNSVPHPMLVATQAAAIGQAIEHAAQVRGVELS